MSRRFNLLTAALMATLNLLAASGWAAETSSPLGGGWRLTRTANPAGGADAVSIFHIADLPKSDPNLAGLMFRCADQGIELLVVVVSPLPPIADPRVTIAANGQEWQFDARVIPPGLTLLLPTRSADLAAGVWQSAHQLDAKVTWQSKSLSGVVPIDGLAAALTTLIANCPAPDAEQSNSPALH